MSGSLFRRPIAWFRWVLSGRREHEILERNWQSLLKVNADLAKALKGQGYVTPGELRARGWEGVSGCRCYEMDEGEIVPCPPQFCQADDLAREVEEMSRWHLIAFSLLTDAQMDEYRRRKNLTPEELQAALDA
jgi:hypothetical protein